MKGRNKEMDDGRTNKWKEYEKNAGEMKEEVKCTKGIKRGKRIKLARNEGANEIVSPFDFNRVGTLVLLNS
jgi:hypothetical protein